MSSALVIPSPAYPASWLSDFIWSRGRAQGRKTGVRMAVDHHMAGEPLYGADLADRCRDFVGERAFPCVGAKSALARGGLKTLVACDVTSTWDDLPISEALSAFAADYRDRPDTFQSLAVIFTGPDNLSENAFETALWARLQSLSDKDAWLGHDHDSRVSDDVDNPHFSLSFSGQAFFVVGLHPGASRLARRFSSPWCSTLTTSSSACARRAATMACERRSSNGIWPSPARPTRCWPTLVRFRRRVSIAVVASGNFGNARSSPRPGVLPMPHEIAPRTGVAFRLPRTWRLRVIDPEGEQVSDLLAFNADDPGEVISSGRTLDYAGKLFLTTGDQLYSNRSRVMLRIVEDTVGRHDFLLTPCSRDTFRIIYGDENPHRGCFGNLAEALAPFGIGPDQIPTAFNVFMNVRVDADTGRLTVAAPLSRAGDHILFEAEQDLIVGLTACSAPQSNNHAFKPIVYAIEPATEVASAVAGAELTI